MIAKQFDPSTNIRTIIKSLSQPAGLCLYDMLEQCFRGEIELIQEYNNYYYRVV